MTMVGTAGARARRGGDVPPEPLAARSSRPTVPDVLTTALPHTAGSDALWLRYLSELGALAALRPLDPPCRVLLGLPTGDLAAAILACSALGALASHRCDHSLDRLTADDVGCDVSTFQSGAYEDRPLAAASETELRVSAVTHTIYADVVRRLPNGFPGDRRPRKLRQPIVDAWTAATRNNVDGRRLHARVAATPVVVIGHRSAFAEDIVTLEELWPQMSQLADVGHDLDSWFRHPVLVCGPATPPPAWLREVTPAVVICDGAAAWRSPLRRVFATAAHILVLDRRAPVAVDEAQTIFDAQVEAAPVLREPPPGIEAWRIVEHLTPVADADEDLF